MHIPLSSITLPREEKADSSRSSGGRKLVICVRSFRSPRVRVTFMSFVTETSALLSQNFQISRITTSFKISCKGKISKFRLHCVGNHEFLSTLKAVLVFKRLLSGITTTNVDLPVMPFPSFTRGLPYTLLLAEA